MSRPERVAQRIKFEVSRIFQKEVDDPRIGFVTVTRVSVSPDLSNATIFVSVLGDESQKKETMKGVLSAKKFIRASLGAKLKLRLVPQIAFVLDESLEKASRLWNLMDKIK